jgi:acetolactate synthase small subunit
MLEPRRVFIVKVQDAPGALTAIASVFSSRGVSLEMILGNGTLWGAESGGGIVVVFRSNERKRQTLLRTLQRLEKVKEVQAYPFDSPQLRAVAIARLNAGEGLEPLPECAEVVTQGEQESVLLFNGGAQTVVDAILAIKDTCVLREIMVSVMAV